jgi:hypothetical protein
MVRELNFRNKSTSNTLVFWVLAIPNNPVCGAQATHIRVQFKLESLILAQNERWRRA